MIDLFRPPVKLQRHLKILIKAVCRRRIKQYRSKFRALVHLQFFHQQQHILGNLISLLKSGNGAVISDHFISHRQIQPVIFFFLRLFQRGKHKRLHLCILLCRKKSVQFLYKFICRHTQPSVLQIYFLTDPLLYKSTSSQIHFFADPLLRRSIFLQACFLQILCVP